LTASDCRIRLQITLHFEGKHFFVGPAHMCTAGLLSVLQKCVRSMWEAWEAVCCWEASQLTPAALSVFFVVLILHCAFIFASDTVLSERPGLLPERPQLRCVLEHFMVWP
jgi:hypothetical protein